jgi:hypothetical protein
MKKIANLSHNVFLSVEEEGTSDRALRPIAEFVLVLVEPSYEWALIPPKVEGAPPTQGVAKTGRADTVRFAADKNGVQAMMRALSEIYGELESLEVRPDEEERFAAKPEKSESTHGVIATP